VLKERGLKGGIFRDTCDKPTPMLVLKPESNSDLKKNNVKTKENKKKKETQKKGQKSNTCIRGKNFGRWGGEGAGFRKIEGLKKNFFIKKKPNQGSKALMRGLIPGYQRG